MADPQILAALVGAVVGAVFAAAAGYFLDWLRQRATRRAIAAALHAEVEIIIAGLDGIIPTANHTKWDIVLGYASMSHISRRVFDGLVSQIGLFDKILTHDVVQFYATLHFFIDRSQSGEVGTMEYEAQAVADIVQIKKMRDRSSEILATLKKSTK